MMDLFEKLRMEDGLLAKYAHLQQDSGRYRKEELVAVTKDA